MPEVIFLRSARVFDAALRSGPLPPPDPCSCAMAGTAIATGEGRRGHCREIDGARRELKGRGASARPLVEGAFSACGGRALPQPGGSGLCSSLVGGGLCSSLVGAGLPANAPSLAMKEHFAGGRGWRGIRDPRRVSKETAALGDARAVGTTAGQPRSPPPSRRVRRRGTTKREFAGKPAPTGIRKENSRASPLLQAGQASTTPLREIDGRR